MSEWSETEITGRLNIPYPACPVPKCTFPFPRRRIPMKKQFLILAAVFLAAFLCAAQHMKAADGDVPFDGAKGDWHGFDRYDFLLDENTLEIEPANAKNQAHSPGQRRCIVVVPKTPAPGNP